MILSGMTLRVFIVMPVMSCGFNFCTVWLHGPGPKKKMSMTILPPTYNRLPTTICHETQENVVARQNWWRRVTISSPPKKKKKASTLCWSPQTKSKRPTFGDKERGVVEVRKSSAVTAVPLSFLVPFVAHDERCEDAIHRVTGHLERERKRTWRAHALRKYP